MCYRPRLVSSGHLLAAAVVTDAQHLASWWHLEIVSMARPWGLLNLSLKFNICVLLCSSSLVRSTAVPCSPLDFTPDNWNYTGGFLHISIHCIDDWHSGVKSDDSRVVIQRLEFTVYLAIDSQQSVCIFILMLSSQHSIDESRHKAEYIVGLCTVPKGITGIIQISYY